MLSVFSNLIYGLGVALTPDHLTIAFVGLILGTAIGVLPGLGGTNGVALLLPLTFHLTPTAAIILLASVYWGALFGGAITSILFNIPGEPWAVATFLFTFFAPPLAEWALKFGPPENFAVLLLAFATFTGLGGGDPAKTLFMTLFGLLLSTVGFDIVSGAPRLNFGLVQLQSGINFIVVAI